MELLMKHYQPGSREDHDLFQTTSEIEVLLRKETEGLIKISSQQLGKALRMLGYTRDNRYAAEKEYPIKAYYLKFRDKNG